MEYSKSKSTSMKLKNFMGQHSLASFFFMACTFSWVIIIPYILSEWYIFPHMHVFKLFFAVNPFFGPMLSAYIMNRISGGNNLKKRLKIFRVGWRWYLLILLVIPAVMLLGIVVLPGAISSLKPIPLSLFCTYPLYFIVILIFGGPLGEEIGWRGYALPLMQSRYGSLKGTLLLGVMWTFWHLPHFLTSAQRGGPGTGLYLLYMNFSIFFLMVMSINVIFTWVFNRTKGSIFMAILLHASIDTFGGVFQQYFTAPIVNCTDLSSVIGFGILAMFLIMLTKGKLGFTAEMMDNIRFNEINS